MASDPHPEHEPRYVAGNHIRLQIAGSDAGRLTGYCNRLAEGGQVVMPLEKQGWGAVDGQLVDRFGASWIFNIREDPPAE